MSATIAAMAQTARQQISFEEYVRMEAMSLFRHEWLAEVSRNPLEG